MGTSCIQKLVPQPQSLHNQEIPSLGFWGKQWPWGTSKFPEWDGSYCIKLPQGSFYTLRPGNSTVKACFSPRGREIPSPPPASCQLSAPKAGRGRSCWDKQPWRLPVSKQVKTGLEHVGRLVFTSFCSSQASWNIPGCRVCLATVGPVSRWVSALWCPLPTKLNAILLANTLPRNGVSIFQRQLEAFLKRSWNKVWAEWGQERSRV